MKPYLTAAAAMAVMLAAGAAHAADKVTLQLKWVADAQFAGYYVAKDKGFYKDENCDVTIKPGGPDIAPEQVLVGGGADVVVGTGCRRRWRRAKRAPRWSTSRNRSSAQGSSSPAAPTPASRRPRI